MLPWLKEKIVARKQRWLRPRTDEIKPSQSETQDDVKSEEFFGCSSDLQLKIITTRLGIVNVHASQFDSGLQLIEKAIKKLETTYSPSSSFSDDMNCYKLVRSSTKKPFRDYDSLFGCKVKNNEEFLLLTKRSDCTLDNLMKVQECRGGPSEKEILVKTKNLPLVCSTNLASLSTAMTMDSSAAFFQGDLQTDLRKILSEIAKYSAFILGTLPFGGKLINYYRQKILMSLYNHQDIVKLLMDMGFSRENVLRALRLQGNNYSLALDWLVENVSKSSLSNVQNAADETSSSSLDISTDSMEDIAEATYRKLCRKTFPSTNSIFYPRHKAISIKEKVEGLLEIVRYYSERNEESNGELKDTISSLVNLGFQMDDIEHAMRVTGNSNATTGGNNPSSSYVAVCEYLLENCAESHTLKNALRESIFVETHILKILLNTPQIQMSLSSPKFFIAYCSMLENYSSLNIFFNDLESQNLLQHILRTYHEERIYFHTFSNASTSSSSTNLY